MMLHVIATIMLRMSRDTDEERDDLKTSRSVLLCGEYSSLQSNLTQTVHNRLLTRGPPLSDPVFLSV